MVATFSAEQEWLPRVLAARGFVLRYLGKFVSTYDDNDLYLVERRPAEASRRDAGSSLR